MGRAIVRNPQVFLFDEPLSNLDAKLRVQMRAEIKELHQRLRTTTVYVTHDQIEAMTMADTIVVMNGGNVEQSGAPLDLYDRPANLFVAGFIGSPAMNLMRGASDGSQFRSESGVAWPMPSGLEMPAGRPIVYGVRPEHLQVGASGVPATVQVIEPTGSETQVIARVGATQVVGAFRERISARPGETITLSADPGLVHLFDAETGMRCNA
jgi:multiple sugar transport system ATP-binding protein